MIKRNKASIAKLIIHKVGNKFNSATNVFSEEIVNFDEESYNLMLPFLLKSFGNVAESFRFNHHANIDLNEINTYTNQVFTNPETFVEVSKHIVNHLYEQSNAAQIKTGDVIIALFEDVEYKDIFTQAIGVFKIENKIDFFQTYMENESLDVYVQKGISTKKLDKGCLIINYSDAEGRTILSIDNNNYDAQYWTKHFLNIKYANDHNSQTQNYFELCKDYADEVVKEDLGIHEKNKFLASAVDYFKENETVDYHNFKDELFEADDQKASFESYKKQFEENNDVVIHNHFPISDIVLKKQKQKIKTEINLDTNIKIKLDIDAPDASTEYLEKGFDENRKMKYYKVYFNEEK